MLIDWFTVGAQALNFIILVWLMKHFLYKPVLHAIDVREKRIAAKIADAEAKDAGAQAQRVQFEHKNEEFDRQRAELLGKARDDAETERKRLLDEARVAATALSTKQEETRRREAHEVNQTIGRRVQQEVFEIARKTLADLAGTSLEERMGDVFVRQVRELGGDARTRLADSIKTAHDAGVVCSAFELPSEQRAAIQNTLNVTFSADVHLRFETSPDRVSGIEFTINGQKVAWSIAEYLASLEKRVGELLESNGKTESPDAVKTETKAVPKGHEQVA